MEKNRINSEEPVQPDSPGGDRRKQVAGPLREKRKERSKSQAPAEMQRLIVELESHQVELEAQNQELRQAQAALQASQDRYADLYDSAPIGYFTLDHEGMIVEANLTGAGLLGVKRDRLIGKPFLFFVEKGNRETFYRHLKALFKSKRRQSNEIKVNRTTEEKNKKKRGSWFWAELDSIYIENVGGGRSSRTILSDITARKEAEAALRQSQQQLALVMETAPVSILYFDVTMRIIFANRAYLERIRKSPDEVIGKRIQEVLGEENYQRMAPYLARTLSGEPLRYEIRIDYPGLGERDLQIQYAPELGDDGSVKGIVAAIEDITYRKEAEKGLRESERRLQQAIAIETVGVIFFKMDGRITGSNDAFLRMSGYNRKDLENGLLRWDRMTPPEWMSLSLKAIEELQITGRTTPYEKEYIRKDGSRWWALFAAARLTEQEGVEFIIDTAERKQTEVLLQRQAEELERSNRLKDEFLATLSHELRTPLNAILGWSSLLRERKRDPAILDRALEIIERNAKAQNRLVEDMLDLSRIIMGKLRLEINRIEFIRIIQAAIDAVRPALEAKQIELSLDLHPSASALFGDLNRLQQVVWNLLSNAIKFNHTGGRVHVRLEKIDSHIELQVKDNGQGIDPAFLPHVFDRFRQADSNINRSQSGLGLGLSIVRHLVEQHGGSVRVESPGKGMGATFTVILPVRGPVQDRDQDKDKKEEIFSPEPTRTYPALDGVRVLVIDDEADARDLIRSILEICNAKVTAVGSAREALELFGQSRPDVVISDIGMPEEDGYLLIRKLRALEGKREKPLPAVALTAYARQADSEEALSAGYQMHLPKPIEPERLAWVVASLAGRGV